MPSKKKSRKKNQKGRKNRGATETARHPQKSTKARARRKPVQRSAKKTKASKKSTAVRKRPQINALSDIERDARNQKLKGAGRAIPQSDFQGLSRAEEADSESVEELVEEGNIVESGAVAGVEKADDEDEREVHTEEFEEDDVPDEYLDKD